MWTSLNSMQPNKQKLQSKLSTKRHMPPTKLSSFWSMEWKLTRMLKKTRSLKFRKRSSDWLITILIIFRWWTKLCIGFWLKMLLLPQLLIKATALISQADAKVLQLKSTLNLILARTCFVSQGRRCTTTACLSFKKHSKRSIQWSSS